MSGCDDDHKLFVRIASPSEKIYLGFNTTNLKIKITKNGVVLFGPRTITLTSQGYLRYLSQAIAGPNVLNVHGYNALQFAPGSPGDYSIEFEPAGEITRFDITVIDTAVSPLAAIEGRLWSKNWRLATGVTSVPANVFLGTMYIYSDDSVVTSIYFNRMLPGEIDLTANSNGLFPPPARFDTSRMSRNGRYLYPQFKIFLSNPDSTQFPTGTLGLIQNGVLVTPQCDGSFMLTFTANKPGEIKVEIEVNPLPGHQPEDVTLTTAVTAGTNTITWNGLDGLGVPVPSGTVVGINISYINGLTNVALFSIVKNLYGFIVSLVRPSGPPLAMYWDDSKLPWWGGLIQLDGCHGSLPSNGCHTWDGGSNWGLGQSNTVNSWWYACSSNSNLGNFTALRFPQQAMNILGPQETCSYSTEAYTIQPDPLPDADPGSYNWVLTDANTGATLFDAFNKGTTINIDFSLYPAGPKWLKVRGSSTTCAFGPFGPGANGILINSNSPPQITNAANSLQICSGGLAAIFLQASIPLTTFSYTASATSVSVSGYFPGNVNPILQTLFNSGTEADSVIYRVVPATMLCDGDTTSFYVIVSPNLPVGVSIAAPSNPACAGYSVTFTAAPANGGTAPHFQWYVNGTGSGTDSPVFSYIPANNDNVYCEIMSNSNCVAGNPAISSTILMTVKSNPDVSFTSCFDTVTTINAKPFRLGGGIPYGGTYSGSGVNPLTGVFTPSAAGLGLKTINYTSTNSYSCSAFKSRTILVQSPPLFACGNSLQDIRDGKSYPTILIGTQCWMASNLNYGKTVSASRVQYDNCISEKHCINDLPGNCTNYGGLYQWEEMMKYDDTPAGQGLCPPGWHVPTEGEWTILFNFYQGNSLAGKPLQDPFTDGFKALQSGVFYLNSRMSFMGFATIFWSSTPGTQDTGIAHGLNSNNNSVSLYESSKANSLSVRCLKD